MMVHETHRPVDEAAHRDDRELADLLPREEEEVLHHGAEEARSCAAAGILIVSGILLRNMTNDLFVRDGALLFWSLNGALLGYLLRREGDPA